MKSLKSFLSAKCFVLLLSMLATGLFSFGQIRLDTTYLPQVNIVSQNGFGPYTAGTVQENLFVIDSLPADTYKVTFRFIDVDSVQVGEKHIMEGQSMFYAYWSTTMQELHLPLSSRLHIGVEYSNDSVANYFMPYLVYPDTLNITASKGWGPFITNNYNLNDSLWNPVPELTNTFTVKNLPPRTHELGFFICRNDTTTIDSLIVTAKSGQYLDSACFPAARMDNLPLTTGFLKMNIKCNGGPTNGWESFYTLTTCLQKPILKCITEDGQVLLDSIKPAFQNQLLGRALLIDSVKYASATNFPSGQLYSKQGVYSLDLASSQYSIEAWLKLDMHELIYGTGNEMSFMKVDSVWALAITSNNIPEISFTLYSMFNDEKLEVARFDTTYQYLMDNDAWHHIAFVSFEKFEKQFYLDGAPIQTQLNNANITYLINNSVQVLQACKTQPFLIGGCNATANKSSEDPTLINAIDEIRIWDKALTAEEVGVIYDKPVIQDVNLIGYWNFDDLNCAGNEVSDISYKCNNALLFNSAALIPQYPRIQESNYHFNFISSNKDIFPLKYFFFDEDGAPVDSGTVYPYEGMINFTYNIESLPNQTNRMQLIEYVPVIEATFTSDYNVEIYPPAPIATPRVGWGSYYASSQEGIPYLGDTGILFNPVSVSSLPGQTKKVTLGWESNGTLFDTVSFTSSSIPWAHSLTLNGTDNYIASQGNMENPNTLFSLMFWFKTSTAKGGEMAGFVGEPKNMGKRSSQGPYIKMKNDGAVEFNLPVADSMVKLEASNRFNDGKWHHLAACYDGQNAGLTRLYIDGTLTDQCNIAAVNSFQGKFYVGKNFEDKTGDERVAEYFLGSFSEIVLLGKMMDYKSINRQMYKTINVLNAGEDIVFYYKLDERAGTLINDANNQQFNANLYGSSPIWSYENELSCVTWNRNILEYPSGEYNFTARVFAESMPDTGISYPLGRINIFVPIEGFHVTYNFEQGLGYFDEGTKVNNRLYFWTDYDRRDVPNWAYNQLFFNVFDPNGFCTDQCYFSYTDNNFSFFYDFDMGEVITGSYLVIAFAYNAQGNTEYDKFDYIPFFTRAILPPKVSGNFGPFDQWIAPHTMTQLDTFYVITEVYDDLKVKAKFYDEYGSVVADTVGRKINDTTFHIVYNMASLPPPGVNMTVGYYLGNDIDPALTQGPFHITIHRTRPRWFDFVPDENFSEIVDGNPVTFKITSPIEDNNQDFVSELSIPSSVPFFGGASASIKAATVQTHLKYFVTEYKLELNGAPVFNQEILNLGCNSSSFLSTEFDTTNNQFYLQPGTNNIIASQNMNWSGSIHSKYDEVFDILNKIKEIVSIAKEVDIGSIVQPTFDISFKGNYQFSNRLHLITDSLTGKWGSFGDLKVTANPNNPNYNKSASFHFYSGALGMEFTIGAELITGLAEVDFCLDADFPLGFGESYRSIPHIDNRFLKSFGFRTYGKVIAKIFWDWYEETVWGPKMFYSTTLWGDDMSECFPPIDKEQEAIKVNSSWPELAGAIVPATNYNKIPLAYPEATIATSGEYKLFTWIERGDVYGERKIKARIMNRQDKLLSPVSTIEINHHAINSPLSDAINNNDALFCWAQTHFTSQTFLKAKPDQALGALFESQDIWFASFNLESDSLMQMEKITADGNNKQGIARANPIMTRISANKTLVIWQLVDMETQDSHIWYSLLTRNSDTWAVGTPQVLASYPNIQTRLQVGSPYDDMATLVWLNTKTDDPVHNHLMSASFDGNEWSGPEILLDEDHTHYNYFDLCLDSSAGGLALTAYNNDPEGVRGETLRFIPWDESISKLNTAQTALILTDTIKHLQYPEVALFPGNKACVAIKREEMIPKDSLEMISQIDLFTADPSTSTGNWLHLPLSEYVCDTTKQVAEIELTFIGQDSLMMLTHEYPMSASNSKFKPLNGVIFGDPYMNLVLRSFMIHNDTIVDLQENGFFTSVEEHVANTNPVILSPNYPNPCKDFTRIGFELPERLHITLEIFDSKGYKIASLANQQMNAGKFEMSINTGLLEPGTYIYTLTTKYGRQSSRMIVVK